MTETRYCIICGEPFESDDPEAVFCPAHGGKAPANSGQKTRLEGEPQPTAGKPIDAGKTRLEGKGTLDDAEESPQEFMSPGQDLTDWKPGDLILDTYEVKGKLGEGGFGAVYRAHHKSWNMDLAIKRALKLDQDNKQDFIDEAQHWIDLGLHPHIISCYYVRNIDGFPHTFAELAEGGSLHDWIEKDKGNLYEGDDRQFLARILDIAIQFAWGLGYAHEQGLVHQDVKPHNALMTLDGVLKVTDFGLAKVKGTGSTAVEGGSIEDILVSGGSFTPAYCSPEQAGGQKLSHMTDIWSWGVSVLEMFTGGVSWMGGQVAAFALESYLQRAEDQGDIPPMPDAVAELLRGCFQEDPQARPRDMLEIADRLIAVYQQETGQTYSRETPKPADLRADSLNNKALSMMDLGYREEAEKLWKEALNYDSHHVEASYNLGLLQWRQGKNLDDLQLIQRLEEVISAQPLNYKPYFHLAEIHLERGDFKAAEETYNRAAKAVPDCENKDISNLSTDLEKTCHLKTMVGATPPIALIPHSKRLVAVSSSNYPGKPSSLIIYDILSGRRLATIPLDGIPYVNKLLLTADGTKAIISWNGPVHVWNIVKKRRERILRGGQGWERAIYVFDMALSQTGKRLVVVNQRTINCWQLSDGVCIYSAKLEGARCAVISADGTFAYVGLQNGLIQIWPMTNHSSQIQNDSKSNSLAGHRDSVTALAISQDGRRLVSSSTDRTIRVWSVPTGECLHEFCGHDDEIWKVILTPDGQRAVCLGSDGIQIWNLLDGHCLKVLVTQKQRVNDMVLTPNGKLLLTGDNDEMLRVWDVESGSCLRSFSGHKYDIKSIVITPDNQFAISAEEESYKVDYELHLWGLAGIGTRKADWALSAPISYIDVTKAENQAIVELDHAETALKAGYIREASEALRKAQKLPGYERDPRWLRLWRQAGERGGQIIGLLFEKEKWTLIGHQGQVFGVACSSDGEIAASSGYEGVIWVWDLKKGKSMHQLMGHDLPVGALNFTPDDRQILSSGNDQNLRLWDAIAGSELQIFSGHTSIVPCNAISQNGQFALSGSHDNIILWDLDSGRRLSILSGHTGIIYSVVFTPGNRFCLSGGADSIIRMWDLNTEACIAELNAHNQDVYCIRVTSDGLHAISAGGDGVLIYWDLQKKSVIRKLLGHRGVVRSVVFTPDDQFAISGGQDQILRIWNLENGMCIRKINAHQNTVTSLAISSEGNLLISGSVDTNVKVWELTWDYQFD